MSMLRDGSDADAAALALTIEQGARGADSPVPMGEVVLAGAGPGDPDLLTLGARAVLADADVVFHDALVGPGVLRLCGPRARLVDAGKRSGRRSTPQEDINTAMIAAARSGDLVVRLKGGDPFLFGRGGEEVEALRRAGVPVRVIPGVSAALAAPASAGIPVTHRGVAASVAFVTGHRVGGDLSALEALAQSVDTLVILMPAELEAIAGRLSRVLGADRPSAIISQATTADQLVVRAPIGSIAAAAQSARVVPPSTLVIGEVVNVLSDIGGVAAADREMFAEAVASRG
jgi:uroporphyrin-III C-methyltransferase